jgi:SAM-dependent methyltransferase
MEPFDSFWEAPEDIEKGYGRFSKFYRSNYLKHFPKNKEAHILVVSCGPGYFVNLLKDQGFSNVLGIDSDPAKIKYAQAKGLNCEGQGAFHFLEGRREEFDIIVAEQEINHLTLEEIIHFFHLCRQGLKKGGRLIIHSINGANPIIGVESLTQNIDHFNSFTEYSLRQVLEYGQFSDIRIFPLNLCVFYENPVNYVGLIADKILSLSLRLCFIFYGKANKTFSKKIGAVATKET